MFDIDLEEEGGTSLPFLLKEHKISKAEAVRLAQLNYARVEKMLRKEVRRDAVGKTVWED
jgi:hypothetical protein